MDQRCLIFDVCFYDIAFSEHRQAKNDGDA